METTARDLKDDIDKATAATCHKQRPFHPKAAPWWTEACSQAVLHLRHATDKQARKTASACLKGAVQAAKRTWANGVITRSSLWEVATWRHGRRTTKIPPLRGENGLTHNHTEMTTTFSKHFFIETPPDVPLHLVDNPKPRPTRCLPEIRDSLIRDLLAKTTNASAPGASGHTWKILKWVWEINHNRISQLVRACVKAGHHPREWKEATVCMIPKPVLRLCRVILFYKSLGGAVVILRMTLSHADSVFRLMRDVRLQLREAFPLVVWSAC